MADAQRVVEGIRNFLHSGHQVSLDALRALAQDYVQGCDEVNRRLARCEEYLRRGMRSEAIHFAEAEPHILDLLAVLDFPERPEWDKTVGEHQFPAPPVFRMETAAALNRAYAESAPLEELLKRHRLLALARAPVAERLGVMRQLAQLDPSSPFWDQDIVALEKVRLLQLRGEVEALARRKDVPSQSRLEGLLVEVRGIPGAPPSPGPGHHGRRDAERGQRRSHDAAAEGGGPRPQRGDEEQRRGPGP